MRLPCARRAEPRHASKRRNGGRCQLYYYLLLSPCASFPVLSVETPRQTKAAWHLHAIHTQHPIRCQRIHQMFLSRTGAALTYPALLSLKGCFLCVSSPPRLLRAHCMLIAYRMHRASSTSVRSDRSRSARFSSIPHGPSRRPKRKRYGRTRRRLKSDRCRPPTTVHASNRSPPPATRPFPLSEW